MFWRERGEEGSWPFSHSKPPVKNIRLATLTGILAERLILLSCLPNQETLFSN